MIAPADIPVYKPEFAEPDLERIHNPDPSRIQITWIGHATFLIQVAGVNILTDPIFSDRASPVSFAGPKRLARPGLTFESLPEIDAVIISHNHYDHLDRRTIERLGAKPAYFVPLGVDAWLHDLKLEATLEALGDVVLHAVPTQHFSGRSLFDRNEALWCGWVIETPAGNVYFAGDTGYSPDFKEIGGRFGGMEVSMIPIGAYRPRWFMGPVHVDPAQAVQVHQDVRSKLSIGMHWGTFSLADEPAAEPPIYLHRVLQQNDLSGTDFRVLKFGEMVLR